jgi:hypothetical protein
VVAAAEVVDEHLFDGLVEGDGDMTDGASADEVANFFGEILGVVAGALQRLGHEDNLKTRLQVQILGILDVAQEDKVAEPVHFSVGTQDVDRLANIPTGKRGAAVAQHFFEKGRHLREIAGVLGIDASADGEGAVGEAEQQITDALQSDHDFHAGQQFAGFGGSNFRDGDGDSAVDFHVEGVKFAFALAQRIEQGGRPGGDAPGSRAGSFLSHATGFDGPAHQVVMNGFRSGSLGRAAHRDVRCRCIHLS